VSEEKSLVNNHNSPHGNANKLDLQRIIDLMTPCPTRKKLCQILGQEFGKETITGEHLNNFLFDKFGMNYGELKKLIWVDVADDLKGVAIELAHKGDLKAIQYVLKNVSDWDDKQAIDLSNKGEAISINLNYKKKVDG
jgi:hypothetical protein